MLLGSSIVPATDGLTNCREPVSNSKTALLIWSLVARGRFSNGGLRFGELGLAELDERCGTSFVS